MSKLTFTDGETFDLSGPLRLEERYDGWYVLGNNRMIPVSSQDAGHILITQLNNQTHERNNRTYNKRSQRSSFRQ